MLAGHGSKVPRHTGNASTRLDLPFSGEVGLLSPEQNPLPANRSSDIHLCVCFFGLLRNLNFTIGSIEDNLFAVLEEASIRYTVYLHTFQLSGPLYNPRSLDFATQIEMDYSRLRPKKVLIESQDAFDEKADFDEYTTKGDPYGDNYMSHRNQIREGHSLDQVTKLWLRDNAGCTHHFYTRPDLFFVAPFDIRELFEVRRMSWFTGAYHEFHGYNDRFAFGDPEGMKIWGSRIHFAKEYSQKNLLLAEPFVKHVSKLHGIKQSYTSLCLLRFRSSGINPSDVDICDGSALKKDEFGGNHP